MIIMLVMILNLLIKYSYEYIMIIMWRVIAMMLKLLGKCCYIVVQKMLTLIMVNIIILFNKQ